MTKEFQEIEEREIDRSGFRIQLKHFPPLRKDQPTVQIRVYESDDSPMTLSSPHRNFADGLKEAIRRMRDEGLVKGWADRVTGEKGDEVLLIAHLPAERNAFSAFADRLTEELFM